MEFEWDENKNQANQAKHQISFEEATEIFDYPIHEEIDNRFQYDEIRYVGIGRTRHMVILTVVYTERGSTIRIISARRSTKQERELYYEYYT